MGKKKRNHPDVEEIISRPWCYYCERDFDDLKILISHQKAKHFKCERCGRRLNTAGGLNVHMSQVHKETLGAVENALPNRAGLDIEIFGMEGIPEEVVQAHNTRVLTQFHQAQADHRAATGNPATGSTITGGNLPKKPKLETASDLKKRLAEHKAKVAAGQASTGGSSGDNTPLGAGQNPAIGPAPGAYGGSPSYPPPQQPYNGAPPSAGVSYPPPYGQPGAPYQAPPGAFQQTPNEFASPPFQQYSPPGQGYQPQPQFAPPGMQSMPPQFQNSPPGGPPRGFGTTSPSIPFHNHQQSPRTHTPPQNGSFAPPRPGSLPPAPGLPQRPAVGPPPVNSFQMQQMHQGQIPSSLKQTQPNSHGSQEAISSNATSLDDLVSSAAKAAEDAQKAASTAPRPDEKPREEKSGKKDKEKSKPTRLIYSDNEVSPEEKMAKLSRYAFVPDTSGDIVLDDAVHATVASAVDS